MNRLVLKSIILLYLLLLSHHGVIASSGYFPHLHQRTTYLDNLANKYGWWANPALPASIKQITVYSGAVTPLANYYLITSGRFFVPFPQNFTVGIGILGTALHSSGSSNAQVRGEAFSYSSRFHFTNPRFQIGIAGKPPWLPGDFGTMATIGWTTDSLGGVEISNHLSPGLSFGWISPPLAKSVRLSWSVMWIRYQLARQTDHITQKIGIQAVCMDSLVTGSFEYTLSAGRSLGVFAPHGSYEVLKGLIYLRAFRAVTLMTGLSMDTDATNLHNGFAVHGGVSVTERKNVPFSGSYEIGAHLGSDWLLLHQVTFRVNLNSKQRQ